MPDTPYSFTADTYAGRVGEEADVFLNVLLLNGRAPETVSLHAARAKAAGRRWGCVVCRCLALFEANHCAKTLDPNTIESRGTAIRFGLLMLAGLGAVIALIRYV